ncbi:related to methyltransferase [Phialocephala subalpina]|uniref:Related to methyltransferase n=1 Tax=Phialocephala subalpina TaxID=576137 RepID=A0A1L7XS51_9HELO|nr:related to methyltransferase [Phialocephala subalpina]
MADSQSKSPAAAAAPATDSPAFVPPTETTPPAGEQIEVDHGDSDNDSALGDDTPSTTSLSSSINNHTYENGRRYHAYQSGSYLAPNDEAENDRLDMHHHLAALIIGGRLTTAPIGKSPQRILDVGCGTGIWCIDIGDEYPSAHVLGVDLSPTQPSMVPPNVQFEVDDVEAEWTFRTPFDLIHVRFLACSIIDWPKLAKQCYTHTKPGGWVEFKDWDLRIVSSDDSLSKDSYLYQYHKLLKDAIDTMRREYSPGPQLKRWAEEAGYVNVTEEIIPLPIGMWPRDKRLKEIGAWNYLCLVEGLEAICMRLFTGVFGWSIDEVQVFLAKVRTELKDMKKNRVHPQYTYYVVVGQKPESEK